MLYFHTPNIDELILLDHWLCMFLLTLLIHQLFCLCNQELKGDDQTLDFYNPSSSMFGKADAL